MVFQPGKTKIGEVARSRKSWPAMTMVSIRVGINLFFSFREKITDRRIFFRVMRYFFSLGKIPKMSFPRSQKNVASPQNIGQAHGVSRVRRIVTRDSVQDIPRPSPGSFPRHGWSQKEPCITRALFVQSTEPTRRHSRDQYEIASYFIVGEGFVSPELVVATLARYSHPSRSRRTPSGTIKRTPFARGWFRRFDRMDEQPHEHDNRVPTAFFPRVLEFFAK